MSKFILTNTILNAFLLKYKIKTKFLRNIKNMNKPKASRINSEDLDHVIQSAFLWIGSNEGHTYWKNIQDLYTVHHFKLMKKPLNKLRNDKEKQIK